MKKVLAVVLAAAFLGLTAMGAYAQLPFIQWYYDANLTETARACDNGLPIQTGFVTAVNFNTFIFAVEYQITYPLQMVWVADVTVQPGQDNIGNTPASIASAWSPPLNAQEPTVIMEVLYNWTPTNNDCNCNRGVNQDQPIVVGPNLESGKIQYVNLSLDLIPVVGMISLVCPNTVPVEETSWGQVKALYDN